MSVGSPVVQLRIEKDLLKEIDTAIASRNAFSGGEEWCRSDWIRAAIADKLSHLKRSRKRGRKPATVICWECRSCIPKTEVASSSYNLFGEQIHRCKKCELHKKG